MFSFSMKYYLSPLTEFFLDFLFQKVHLSRFTMNQNNIFRLRLKLRQTSTYHNLKITTYFLQFAC